jgi:hypothetical protein
MARPDLTNEQVQKMREDNPGSAAEYLRLRREELEAEKQAERAADDEARWIEHFVAAGGERTAAKAAYRKNLTEDATIQAVLAQDAAVQIDRQRISGVL